jgi:hypothetical protein
VQPVGIPFKKKDTIAKKDHLENDLEIAGIKRKRSGLHKKISLMMTEIAGLHKKK